MTNKNLVAEENSSEKIEENTFSAFVKPLLEDNMAVNLIVKATAKAMFANQLVDKSEDDFDNLERDVVSLQKELGFIYDADKASKEIRALLKANKLPVNSFFGMKDFVESFANSHYSSFKVLNKVFKTVLGDSYPQEIASSFRKAKTPDKMSMVEQCPLYLIEVVKAGGTAEDFKNMIQERGYISPNVKPGGLKPHRVIANLNPEMKAFEKAQFYLRELGADLLEKGFGK